MMKIFKEILSYVIIIIVVILIRTFLVTPAIVDGESMEPTLYNNELVLINKISLKTKGINRWDIVVVDYENRDELLLKRVIALPGEDIMYRENTLYINGEVMETPIDFEYTREFEASVPEGSYFVMGDNRDVSFDSRMIGAIKKKDIKGKAKFILFPFNAIRKIK